MAISEIYAEAQNLSDGPGQGAEAINPERYAEVLLQLYPPGPLWPREPGTLLESFVRGQLAGELSRTEHRAQRLIREMDPRNAEELLEDWERILALPETSSAATDRASRQRAAHEKLTTIGGASPDFFIELAAKLGYTILIERGHGTEFELDVGELALVELGAGVAAGSSVGEGFIVHAPNGADDAVLEAAILRFAAQGFVVTFIYDL